MEAVAQGIKQGDAAASGAAAIQVEKHKDNFREQHGTFSDKPSQNITRYLQKAQDYKDAHMINSLEMGQIVIFCIKGEAATKIQRWLEVPDTEFIHADHFCKQPLQLAVPYSPYKHRVEPKGAVQEIRDENNEITTPGSAAVPLSEAQPAILPVRYQPEVSEDHCLKHYLTHTYKKMVNLTEAEKFLSTFKTQKPKQTCTNFLDEFLINYENYAHLKWPIDILNGTPATEEQEEVLGNIKVRKAEILRLVIDGICKEFKIHCDNTGFQMHTKTFHQLEDAVNTWQRSTTTGKAFTANCILAKPVFSATVAALEYDDNCDQTTQEESLENYFTSAAQNSSPQSRGQRGTRGVRGGTRGGRGRGARNRGTTSSLSQTPFISRDMEDGNHPNYRQTIDGQLQRSSNGFPLCNYCGGPSHKRQHCPVKARDRENGNKRIFHPDRDKGTSVQDKTKRPTPMYNTTGQTTSAAMQAPIIQQMPQQQGLQPPWWNQPIPNIQPQWQQPSYGQDYMGTNHRTAAATIVQKPSPCPYPTCQAILSDQHQSEDHMRNFHAIQTMAQGTGHIQ